MSSMSSSAFRSDHKRVELFAHRDKVRPGKIPDDASGSADSHVTNERKEPSEINRLA